MRCLAAASAVVALAPFSASGPAFAAPAPSRGGSAGLTSLPETRLGLRPQNTGDRRFNDDRSRRHESKAGAKGGLSEAAARGLAGTFAAALAARFGARPVGRQRFAGFRGASASTARSVTAPTITTTVTTVAEPVLVDMEQLFGGLHKRSGGLSRSLASLPLPMWLLSAYTAIPALAAVGWLLCPNKTVAPQSLAAALGLLIGTAAGAFLDRAKKGAANSALLAVLAQHAKANTPVEQLREMIAAQRKRFGVAQERSAGEAFEESHMCEMYRELLSALIDGPENDASDLPAIRRLKAALNLDGIVVGQAHRRSSQVLVSKGYAGLDEESMRRSTDKLLFLSERAFADEDSEEAAAYEMSRVRDVLQISREDARSRISSVSQAMYRQDLSAVVSRVDASTAEALSGASVAFGLSSQETAKMNAETYRQIAANLLAGDGGLPAEGATTLASARAVLQLTERAADTALAAVAGPMLQAETTKVSEKFLADPPADGPISPESIAPATAALLARRSEELGMAPVDAGSAICEAMRASLQSLYKQACVEAKKKGSNQALSLMDKMVTFAGAGDAVLTELQTKLGGVSEAPLTLTTDTLAARRLYGEYLKRSFEEGSGKPGELARVLELSESDDETARVDVCQPMLKKLYLDTLSSTLGSASDSIEVSAGKGKLSLAKTAVASELSKFQLPEEVVRKVRLESYKERLTMVADQVPKAHEREALDAALTFLDLTEDDVRLLHLKAFAKTYERSCVEALGRSGIMTPAARDALEKLRERVSLGEEDARTIFNGVIQERVTKMMVPVREAWEEATYTKESLVQLWKERGKDVGDDPFADGSGEMGVKDTQPLTGVRGYKLMVELTKVVNFYLGNQVTTTNEEGEEVYPVTVGKLVEDKTKDEIFGIYAWNAVTCQEAEARTEWNEAKPHVGGILGMSKKDQEKVMEKMVSRWATMFIKQKVQDQGSLSEEDVGTLTTWVPTFFGISEDVTKNMVQSTNKTMLQSKVLKLLNQPSVTAADVQDLRDATERWELELKKDLELTRPQLRSLFRVEVTAGLEDSEQTFDDKRDLIDSARESWGLEEKEAEDELAALLRQRCKACLVNAVGDHLQGNDGGAVKEMQRLDLLATFAAETEKIDLTQDWEVSLDMKMKLIKTYASSPLGGASKRAPDIKLLEQVLGLAA